MQIVIASIIEEDDSAVQRIITEDDKQEIVISANKEKDDVSVLNIYAETNPLAKYQNKVDPGVSETRDYTNRVIPEVEEVIEKREGLNLESQNVSYTENHSCDERDDDHVTDEKLTINVNKEDLHPIVVFAKVTEKRKRVRRRSIKPFKKFRLVIGEVPIIEHRIAGNKDRDDDNTLVFVLENNRVENPDWNQRQICPVCEKTRMLKKFATTSTVNIVKYCYVKNVCNACRMRFSNQQKVKAI